VISISDSTISPCKRGARAHGVLRTVNYLSYDLDGRFFPNVSSDVTHLVLSSGIYSLPLAIVLSRMGKRVSSCSRNVSRIDFLENDSGAQRKVIGRIIIRNMCLGQLFQPLYCEPEHVQPEEDDLVCFRVLSWNIRQRGIPCTRPEAYARCLRRLNKLPRNHLRSIRLVELDCKAAGDQSIPFAQSKHLQYRIQCVPREQPHLQDINLR
jgi:hypothetical protein